MTACDNAQLTRPARALASGACRAHLYHLPTSHAPPLGALLRQYAAGSALTCDPVDQGLLNRGYRLRTTRGRYFLKHHFDPETADPAAIARQHRATQRLADLGVPVAPPLPGRDGRTVAVVGGHAYALHPWIDGRHRHGGQLTTVQCGRLGALLGVVHASLERVMPARCQDRASRAGTGGVRRTARRRTAGRSRAPAAERTEPGGAAQRREAARGAAAHRLRAPSGPTAGAEPPRRSRAAAPARPHTATPPRTRGHRSDSTADTRPLLHAVADPADTFALIDDLLGPRAPPPPRRRLRRTGPRTGSWNGAHCWSGTPTGGRRPGGPVGWVHGDFHPFNLLYRGDAPAAIVDWDRLGVQPRAEEAVRAAAIFFVRPVGTLDLAKVRAYARAYRRAAGATPAELAAAVHRVWWERLNDFWMLRWHYERGDTRADSAVPGRLGAGGVVDAGVRRGVRGVHGLRRPARQHGHARVEPVAGPRARGGRGATARAFAAVAAGQRRGSLPAPPSGAAAVRRRRPRFRRGVGGCRRLGSVSDGVRGRLVGGVRRLARTCVGSACRRRGVRRRRSPPEPSRCRRPWTCVAASVGRSSLGVSLGVSSSVDCVTVGDCVVLGAAACRRRRCRCSASATPAAIAITASTARIHSLPRPPPRLPCPSKPPSSPPP